VLLACGFTYHIYGISNNAPVILALIHICELELNDNPGKDVVAAFERVF